MRGLLNKLRCDNYLTLVAASSIIRPGVARSGMMKEYIWRFHHPGEFEYIHPVMEEQLKETYGVMVYQEDVIKVCHHFAGLDLSDADVLPHGEAGAVGDDDVLLAARGVGGDELLDLVGHPQLGSLPDPLDDEVLPVIDNDGLR